MIEIVAYGQPKPKGSLRHVGKGRMVEQLAGSRPWREAVKWAALEARGESDVLTGPVTVRITVTVPKPKRQLSREQAISVLGGVLRRFLS